MHERVRDLKALTREVFKNNSKDFHLSKASRPQTATAEACVDRVRDRRALDVVWIGSALSKRNNAVGARLYEEVKAAKNNSKHFELSQTYPYNCSHEV